MPQGFDFGGQWQPGMPTLEVGPGDMREQTQGNGVMQMNPMFVKGYIDNEARKRAIMQLLQRQGMGEMGATVDQMVK